MCRHMAAQTCVRVERVHVRVHVVGLRRGGTEGHFQFSAAENDGCREENLHTRILGHISHCEKQNSEMCSRGHAGLDPRV